MVTWMMDGRHIFCMCQEKCILFPYIIITVLFTYFIFAIRFSRLIAPVNPADDFNLSTPLFQLYGTSNTGGTLKIFTSK